MIIAGITLFSLGLVLGVAALSAQIAAVLIFDSNERWTNPGITMGMMGLTTAMGLATILAGLSQLAAQ